MPDELARCPWCKSPAGFEEIEARATGGVVWSVGCETRDETAGTQCFGYMSAAKFPTKGEAAAAWNQCAWVGTNDGNWVPLPLNAQQAELMLKLGWAWLEQNAPARLKKDG